MKRKLRKLITSFSVILSMMLSTSSQANEQDFEESAEKGVELLFSLISHSTDAAFAKVWQLDAQAWRYHMQMLACEDTDENRQILMRTQKNGFESFLQVIVDNLDEQRSISGMATLVQQKLVHDFSYSHYLVLSQTYQMAYVQRLKTLFHYHEPIQEPFCKQAQENAKQIQHVFPNDVMPELTSGDLASNEILEPINTAIRLKLKYGGEAFYNAIPERRKNLDAMVYSGLLQNKEAYDELATQDFRFTLYGDYLAEISKLAKYKITQKRQTDPGVNAVFSSTFVKQHSMYLRATHSALKRVAYEYPEIKEALHAHMADFVQQRLDELEQ